MSETQRILIGSQIDKCEVKEHTKLHNLHIYHIEIRSELKYLTGAKVLSSRKWGSAVCKTRAKNRYLVAVRVWNCLSLGGSVPWQIQNRTEATVPVPIRAVAGYPRTIANTRYRRWTLRLSGKITEVGISIRVLDLHWQWALGRTNCAHLVHRLVRKPYISAFIPENTRLGLTLRIFLIAHLGK
jgi:hypothetical protein